MESRITAETKSLFSYCAVVVMRCSVILALDMGGLCCRDSRNNVPGLQVLALKKASSAGRPSVRAEVMGERWAPGPW